MLLTMAPPMGYNNYCIYLICPTDKTLCLPSLELFSAKTLLNSATHYCSRRKKHFDIIYNRIFFHQPLSYKVGKQLYIL